LNPLRAASCCLLFFIEVGGFCRLNFIYTARVNPSIETKFVSTFKFSPTSGSQKRNIPIELVISFGKSKDDETI
jgi:hypothetical protein